MAGKLTRDELPANTTDMPRRQQPNFEMEALQPKATTVLLGEDEFDPFEAERVMAANP